MLAGLLYGSRTRFGRVHFGSRTQGQQQHQSGPALHATPKMATQKVDHFPAFLVTLRAGDVPLGEIGLLDHARFGGI